MGGRWSDIFYKNMNKMTTFKAFKQKEYFAYCTSHTFIYPKLS